MSYLFFSRRAAGYLAAKSGLEHEKEIILAIKIQKKGVSDLKKIFSRAFLLATALLLLLANAASASTCAWTSYQPEVPASLRK